MFRKHHAIIISFMFIFGGIEANSCESEEGGITSLQTFSKDTKAKISLEDFRQTPHFKVLECCVKNWVPPTQDETISFYEIKNSLDGGVDTILDCCEELLNNIHGLNIDSKKESFLNMLETRIYSAYKPSYWRIGKSQ